jgi:predicted enzyme related to lactoylglutathione lyase
MNHFGHIEIPTKDFKIAKKFFGGVFNWKFQEVPDMEYVLFRAGMKPNGGFYKVKRMPKSNQINVYVEVKDINVTLKKIGRNCDYQKNSGRKYGLVRDVHYAG